MAEIIQECSYEFLHSSASLASKCTVATEHCESSYFNLLAANYCVFSDYSTVTLILAVIILAFLFYFVADTSNQYLAPVLGTMSEKLGLSQNLAGLTLLAFGNQAPDVIVAVVAGGDANEGIELALGATLGSALLIISIVLSSVIILGGGANGVPVVPINYMRDFGCFMLILIIIVIFGCLKKIYLWESICYLCLYIIYVLSCFFMDRYSQKQMAIEDQMEGLIPLDVPEGYQAEKIDEEICVVKSLDRNLSTAIEQGYFYKRNEKAVPVPQKRKTDRLTIFDKFNFTVVSKFIKWKETSWGEKNIMQKIIYIILDCPITFIRDITIPPFTIEKWNRWFFILMPFTIPLFVILIFEMIELLILYWPYFLGFFGLMLILSVVMFRVTYRNSLPKFEWGLLIVAFLITMIWLWACTNILMDMMKLISLLLPFNLPGSFYTLTFLSFGNALPDFFNNLSLAKTGYAEMAFSGSIGSPVFGMLVGFGLAMIMANIQKGVSTFIPFDLFNLDNVTNKIIVSALAVLAGNTIRLLIEGFLVKFYIKKWSAYIGFTFYGIFFVLAVTFAIISAVEYANAVKA